MYKLTSGKGKIEWKPEHEEIRQCLISQLTSTPVLMIFDPTFPIELHTDASLVCLVYFGAPVRVIANQGRCFANTDFEECCNSHNIKLHLIATGTSRGNGQVERVMSTLKNMLTSTEVDNERSWKDALGDIQIAMNSSINRVTKASPLELLIGRVARPLSLLPFHDEELEVNISEIREQATNFIEKNAQEEKSRFDKTKAQVSKFVVGDFVLIQNHERNQTKLYLKFRGPFKNVEVLSGDRYLLRASNCERTYKYAHDRLRPMPDCSVPVELDMCDKKVTEWSGVD